MYVIAKPEGFVCVFRSRHDIEQTAKQLLALLEYSDAHDPEPPHLYALYNEQGMTQEEASALLDNIKASLQRGCDFKPQPEAKEEPRP